LSGEIKVYAIGICCLFTYHVALINNRLAQNQNNGSEWRGMSIRGLSFQ